MKCVGGQPNSPIEQRTARHHAADISAEADMVGQQQHAQVCGEAVPSYPFPSWSVAPGGLLLCERRTSEPSGLELLREQVRGDLRETFDWEHGRVRHMLADHMAAFDHKLEQVCQRHFGRQEQFLRELLSQRGRSRSFGKEVSDFEDDVEANADGQNMYEDAITDVLQETAIFGPAKSTYEPSSENGHASNGHAGRSFQSQVAGEDVAVLSLPPGVSNHEMKNAIRTAVGETPCGFAFIQVLIQKIEAFVGSQEGYSVTGIRARILNSWLFNFVSGIAITLNALYIGIQVDVNLKRQVDRLNGGDPTPVEFDFAAVDIGFAIMFTIELLIRILCQRVAFVLGKEARWNMFDFVIVTMSVLELLLDGLVSTSILRTVRITRLIRMLSVFRRVPVLRHLQTMMFAIFNTIPVLVPALGLLIFTMYIVGMMIASGVQDYLSELEPAQIESKVQYQMKTFGSVSAALETSFVSILGGIDWYDVLVALRPAGVVYPIAFLCYIAFVLLAALNIVTGIFVDTARGLSTQDREFAAELEMDRQRQAIRELVGEFEKCSGGKAIIGFSEFKIHFAVERNRAFLRNLGLDMTNLKAAFELMAKGSEGGLSVGQFVESCLRLRGPASSLDLEFIKLDLQGRMSRLEKQTNTHTKVHKKYCQEYPGTPL